MPNKHKVLVIFGYDPKDPHTPQYVMRSLGPITQLTSDIDCADILSRDNLVSARYIADKATSDHKYKFRAYKAKVSIKKKLTSKGLAKHSRHY